MVLLKEILDVDLLQEHVKSGLVSYRTHNRLPLAILNYTAECQWRRQWDDVTRKTRGLIYDFETMQVVARPFEKFFNWDEGHVPYPPSGPALRMEKMDGSLGILYNDRIATRGSFHSEQAVWATEFYWKHLDYVINRTPGPVFEPLDEKTYLFEIIYPQNRIVVDYGDYKGLVLIDVIDNETGLADTEEFDNCDWPDKVKRLPTSFDIQHVHDIPRGDEGYVYLWPTRNFRTKMKSAEYVEIHRLISHLNEKTVWEALVAGKGADDIKKGLPEEFHPWIDETVNSVVNNAVAIVERVVEKAIELERQGLTQSRKDFALAIKDDPDRKYLFLSLDSKPIYPVALQDSKPKNTTDLTREE